MTYLAYAVLGLGSGAVLAIFALGLVLTYKGSGVLNLAQGAIAMYIAYVYAELRNSGEYFLPIPGLPSGLQVHDGGVPTAIALLIALATAAALGLLLHFVVYRPLRRAPALAKIVASIGVLTVLEAVVAYHFGTNPVTSPEFIPTTPVIQIFGTGVPIDRFILVGIVIVLGTGLWALYRFTTFGLVTRASTENEEALASLGYSPDRQAGINWVIACVLAGFGGILIAPLTQLTPTGFTLLVIPALAAALIGRFSSLGITALAGLLLGMVQSELGNLPSHLTWFPSIGTSDAIPFIVIVVALVVVGHSLPVRGSVAAKRLPAAPIRTRTGTLVGCAAFVIAVIVLEVVSGDVRAALINGMIASLFCLSLVVITGFVGQISLFQYAIGGIAAFALAAIDRSVGLPFYVSMAFAAVIATVAGIVAGLPALRVRGVNLAVLTLAAGWAIEEFIFNNPSYTGGINGSTVPAPTLFGINLAFDNGSTVGTASFALLCLVLLSLSAVGVSNLRRGATGRRMLAVRYSERSAAASGVNVTSVKILGFGISSFLAALGGCLLAYQSTTITAASFDALLSVTILVTLYLAGVSSVAGALVAGFAATGALSPYLLQRYVLGNASNPQEIAYLLSGVLLIFVVLQNPEGLVAATLESLKARLHRRMTRESADEAALPTVVGRTAVEGKLGG